MMDLQNFPELTPPARPESATRMRGWPDIRRRPWPQLGVWAKVVAIGAPVAAARPKDAVRVRPGVADIVSRAGPAAVLLVAPVFVHIRASEVNCC